MPDLEIDQLIAQSQLGNRDALDKLCAHYRPVLQKIATARIGREMERRVNASDIVQDTEFEMSQGIDGFRGATEAEFAAWLRTILRRNISDKIRNNRAAIRDHRREHYLDGANEGTSGVGMQPIGREESPSRCVMNGEAALQFAMALQSLPGDQSSVVRMRIMDGMKLSEIAAALNKSTAAVAGLLRRGQEALKDEIGSVSNLF